MTEFTLLNNPPLADSPDITSGDLTGFNAHSNLCSLRSISCLLIKNASSK